jgi:hypothetical protein
MNTPRPLQWVLLIYEAFRLVILTRIMTSGLAGDEFPSLVFGAAQALFPLMALFMLVDIGRYGAYASLYSAGKILGVIVLLSCGIFWKDRLIQAIGMTGEPLLYAVGSLLGIALGDLISAGGGIVLARCSNQLEAVEANVKEDNGGL